MPKKRFPILAMIPLVIITGMAGLFFGGMFRDNPDALPSARKGQVAPVVNLAQLGDLPVFGTADLTDGTVKLVNFWASWCAPCRAEHPNLEMLSSEGVTIYGINYKDQPDKALAFLQDLGNPYAAIGTDSEGRNGLEWGLYGVPETFVIDAEGKIVLRFAGPITQSILDSTIRPAIEAATAAAPGT